MANYRPKSLSELNNVYDKAMRAEKAIKEGSDLLSVPESEATPQSENIFLQLENKAAQAEKHQVFDPDITNIANDFLKRYAKPEKPTAVRNEVKRPAPSIQSVYHSPAKPKQEEKQDISLNMGNDFASTVEAPAVPLHKPAPSMPSVQPKIVKAPEVPVETYVPEIAEPAYTEPAPVSTPAEAPATAAPQVVSAAPQMGSSNQTPSAPVRKAPARVRITSTERNELFEEYMRVMSDDDDEPSEKKSVFSFFKKKKKYEEEPEEELSSDLYEELDEEESFDDEIPVVPFDNSDVKYTDEYSDAPAETEEESEMQETMNISDYIAEDFDYDESEEDDTLDVSLANTVSEETAKIEAEEEVAPSEEIEPVQEYEEIAEETAEDELVVETSEAIEEAEKIAEVIEASEEEETIVYPTEEAEEVVYPDAPPSDMVFEDIFSVTDESKRSHTGGNWEEVFGENFSANVSEEAEEIIADVVEESEDEAESYEQESYDEYPEYEEQSAFIDDTEEIKPKKGRGFLRFLMIFISAVCILLAGATIAVTSLADVNSGKLISDRYRIFSVSENLDTIGLSKGDLVITENAYAHIDSLYVYSDENSDAFNFGKVTANTTTVSGDYFYVTESGNGTKLVNRDNSMGVIIATYAGIGSVLSIVCEYYIFIVGALLILAVAMIICLIIISRKKSDSYAEEVEAYYEDDTDSYNDADSTDEYDEEENYYNDFDTDGIEEGLFSDI